MNEKTAKILRKYAARSGQNVDELKRWWVTLTHEDRAREKKRR